MENLVPVIRNVARAVIVRDEQVLLLRKEGGDGGERYALPGGAQDTGETLGQALDRECLEEIGTRVVIRDLLYVADWFKARDTIPPTTRHQIEFLFACTVPEGYVPINGHHPDKHQVEVVWTPLVSLDRMPFQPRALADCLRDPRGGSVYLGVID